MDSQSSNEKNTVLRTQTVLEHLFERFSAMRQRFDAMDERVSSLESTLTKEIRYLGKRVESLEKTVESLDKRLGSLEMTVENEVIPSIKAVAEGHFDVLRKLDEALYIHLS